MDTHRPGDISFRSNPRLRSLQGAGLCPLSFSGPIQWKSCEELLFGIAEVLNPPIFASPSRLLPISQFGHVYNFQLPCCKQLAV